MTGPPVVRLVKQLLYCTADDGVVELRHRLVLIGDAARRRGRYDNGDGSGIGHQLAGFDAVGLAMDSARSAAIRRF